MNARFFLANPKADKCSIDIIITINNKRYKKGAGVSIETIHWDAKRQCAKTTQRYRDGAKINHTLDLLRAATERARRRVLSDGVKLISPKDFWKLVECERSGTEYSNASSVLFTDYFENVFIPKFITTKSLDRIKRFRVVCAKLKNFETHKGQRYTFDDINITFYRDLREYMNGLQHSTNYFGTIIKVVKQVMLEAQLINELHNNAIFKHSDFKSTSQDVDNVYLSTNELMRIHQTDIGEEFVAKFYPRAYPAAALSIITSYNIVKSRFLIGAYTGLRMSDFNRIDADSMNGGFMTVITEKTNQRVVIPLHPVVKEIIANGFNMSASLSDAKTRLYIKDICRFVGINEVVEARKSVGGKVVVKRREKWELVGTHTARRSFATNAYKAGVPTIAIMKITGHTKESSFMRYIRISQEENAEILAKHEFFM